MNRMLITAAVLLSSSSLLLIDATVKGGVVLLIAACMAMILRRDSAATRYQVWLIAILAILIVPLVSALLPQWRVLPEWAAISAPAERVSTVESTAVSDPPALRSGNNSESSLVVRESNAFPSTEVDESVLPRETPEIRSAKISGVTDSAVAANRPTESGITTSPTWNWTATLTVVWLGGFAVLVMRLLAARLMLWSSERRGTVIAVNGKAIHSNTDRDDERLISVFNAACGDLRISQCVSLTLHPDRTIPIVWGLFNVRLLFPESAREWTAEQQRSVLLHELAHVKRRDLWTQLLIQVANAIYWFNPLVWFAAWRLHVERERACDDLVLNSGVSASSYAEHLLNVATRVTPSPWTQVCGLAMAQRSSLEGRLRAVLHPKRNRRAVTHGIVGLSLLIGGAIAVPVAMLQAADERATAIEPSDDGGELQTPEEQPAQQEETAPDDRKQEAGEPKQEAGEPKQEEPAEAATEDPVPKSETARSLFKQWVGNARLNGMIPGGQLKSLVKATSNFVGYNEDDKRTPPLTELLKRMDVNRDWSQQEAVELLNDVTDVYDSLPQWATDLSRFSIADALTAGKPLPNELKDAPWGESDESGLRTAWYLDPVAKEHRLGTPLKSRILYHNNGTKTVFFRVVSWNQSGAHQARDANGKAIQTLSTSWTTIGQVQAVRLAPGEFTEVIGAGIGVGANIDGEVWRNTRVGTWIHAVEGDEVTFTPDAVTISGSDGRQRDVKDEVWWLTFITQRLERDAPFPDDDRERERILDRAVRDLFDTPPTADEIKTLLADKSPDVLTSLAQRLSERADTISVYGSLQSGSTTFRVLPVDPDAKQKPYLAVGPGRYKFDNGTTLVIVGRGNVMDAKLEFSGENAPEPFPIQLPERGKWTIAWKPNLQAFWIAEKGVVRKVGISNPQEVSEVRIEKQLRIDAPDPKTAKFFLDALRPMFGEDAPAVAAESIDDGAEDVDVDDQPIEQEEAGDAPLASSEGPVRSANRSNRYALSKSRRLTMCRPKSNQPWLTIHWPESETWPKTMRRIEPKLQAENYRNWVAVWEADSDDIWFVDDECFARVNISNPAEVLVTRQKHGANAVLEFDMPEIVKAEFARLGFPVAKYPSSFEVTDGQEMLTSVLTETFKVSGTVTGSNGRPIANVPIRVRAAVSPAMDLATTKTDEFGKYSIRFRLDLRTVARSRGVAVQPILDGFTERSMGAPGMYEALLRPDEEPQHVKIRDYPPMWITGSRGGFPPGPIPRFGDRDLIIGRASIADFVLLPASTLTGTLVDLDGTPLVGHSVSVTAPDADVPRGYETLAYSVTDDKGEFILRNVPANELLNFTATSPGKPADRRTQESATQKWGNAGVHRVRIEADYGDRRKFLKIERLPAKT